MQKLLGEKNESPIDIEWNHLSYSIKTRSLFGRETSSKAILKDVSGHIKGGRVLGIMGPSGSGKTTLLNFLGGRLGQDKSHALSGDVLFNGTSLPPSERSKFLSFVSQDDIVFDLDTPKEALSFNAKIRRNLTNELAELSTQKIIENLGLQKCADTIIGKPDVVRGISGGERKRTNIGAELITEPRVLLLDEPTTGLDSVSALKIIQILKGLAKSYGNTIICTIHQPSSEIFHAFDDLLLLSSGKCIYQGPTVEAATFFRSIGSPVPNHYNPAEHYLKVIHNNPNIQKFAPPGEKNAPHANTIQINVRQASLPRQVQLLFGRSMRNMIRSPIAFYARAFQTVIFILLLGLLYLNIGEDQEGVQDRVGLLFFVIVNQAMVALMNGVIVFPPERAVFLREQASNAYSPYAYAFAKISAELPLQVLFPSLFAVCIYWLTGLSRDLASFGIFLATCILVANTAQSYGLFVSAAISSVQTAMSIVPLTVLPFFLTGGLMANTERLNPWFSWLSYISFIRHGFVSLMRNEFESNKPYQCPEDSGPCLFRNGTAVLKFYGLNDESISTHLIMLCVSMVTLRVLTALSLAYHARKAYPT